MFYVLAHCVKCILITDKDFLFLVKNPVPVNHCYYYNYKIQYNLKLTNILFLLYFSDPKKNKTLCMYKVTYII